MTTRASRTSNERAPSPIHSGRYGVANGMIASVSLIGANPSRTLVTTCTTSSAITSSEVSRCSESIANRGQRPAEKRSESRMPSTTLTVSSTSATAPVERDRYQ